MTSLAEALQRRGALQQAMTNLGARAHACVTYQEGERPSENVNTLLTEVKGVADELGRLVASINLSNAQVTMPDGRTLTEALAERDTLRALIKVVKSVTDDAEGVDSRGGRYGYRRSTRSELKDMTDLDVVQRRVELDQLSRQLRELTLEIEKVNFTEDLLAEEA